MHVGNSPIVKTYALLDGLGQYVQLDEVNHEKDLGVWFTSDLKPSLHCCKAAAFAIVAIRVLSMIRRAFVKKLLVVFCIQHSYICKTPSGILCHYVASGASPYLVRDIEIL